MGTIKIAYFIDRIIRGGTELQLVEQINRLHKLGIEQILFCLYKSTEHESIEINCRTEFLNIKSLLRISTLVKLRAIATIFKNEKIAIVQTYFFDSTLIGVLAGRITGRLRIISCRRDLGFWYTPKLILILKILNNLTDRILVNSKAVMQSVVTKEKVSPSKIDIITNGIDASAFNYSAVERKKNRLSFGIRNNEICVGLIANMSREVKRVDLFIRAASYILEKDKGFKFLILGEGKLKNNLIQMTKEHGIEDFIVFLKKGVTQHKALSTMDIGVLTSDSEGFPNVILEYMAAGLPVVATAVGGNLELVQDHKTGFLTKPGETKELGDKILNLAHDKQKCIEFGANGKKSVVHYNWDLIMERILNYYGKQVS